MTAKSVVGFILGGALASGIWGTVHFFNAPFVGAFVSLIVISGFISVILGIFALYDNWDSE